jgi:hypothetical protein
LKSTEPFGQTKSLTMEVSELLVPVQVGAAVVKLAKVVAAARMKDLMATMLIDGFERLFGVGR